MKQTFILILALTFFSTSCAKKGVTPTKVQLHLAGIVSPGNAIGSGGGILFGRSKTGESFAQIITGAEENIELANGDWSFTALMWDDSQNKMNGNIYCGISATQTLNGFDATIKMDLKNSTCADSLLSSAQIYTDSYSKIHFSDVFFEECDELSANSFTCGLNNQGSARSYKVVFSSYKKSSNGALTLGATKLSSACMRADRNVGIIGNALPINIPGGSSNLAIPLEVRMYLGSGDCDDADPKGVVKVSLDQGIASQASASSALATKVVSYNPNNCAISSSVVVGASPLETKNKCEELLGLIDSAGACDTNSIPQSVTRFAPSAYCTAPVVAQPGYSVPVNPPVYPAIKHMVAISKASLCAPYLNQSRLIGSVPFAGGEGTKERPYKICTEWQLNQIGEPTAPVTFALSSYKLMNDLDMNLVDVGGKDTSRPIYTKPSCAYSNSSALDNYHNLNSLDRLVKDGCSQLELDDPNYQGFAGVFNGNNKTISNGRIFGRNVDGVGFVRKLQAGGVIKNLKFNFLMVQAKSIVGSIAGEVEGPNAEIRDILLERINVSANDQNSSIVTNMYAGGIAAKVANGSFISNVQVRGRVSGGDIVGGLVGELNGKLSKSSFRGEVIQDGDHGDFAAGIAATLNLNSQTGSFPAEISDSFSEGTLEFDTKYLGGIVGRSNGNIMRSYSNMFIKLKNNTTNPNTNLATNTNTSPNTNTNTTPATNTGCNTDYCSGGLIGYSDGGTITDVYFSGQIDINQPGNPGKVYNGIIGGFGSNSNVSFQNCVTSVPPTGTSGCTSLQGTDPLQTGGIQQLTAAVFTQKSGTLPRLTWEQHPCKDDSNLATVPMQASAGKGSAENPIIICNASQLSQISARPSTENYKLGDDISLASWNSSSLITELKGTLEGDGKVLYGLNITASTVYSNPTLSLIGTIQPTGKINNLSIFKSSINGFYASSDVKEIGIVAGFNNGIISNLSLKDVFVTSQADKTGLVVGKNTNTISKIEIKNGIVKAMFKAGMLAGEATSASRISKADVEGALSLVSSTNSIPIFGGIVGSNDGTIDQTRFQGEISTLVSSVLVPGSMMGGIAGYNSGTVSNSLVDNWTSLNFMLTQYVGGLVGSNQGTISKAINLGVVSSYDMNFGTNHYFLPIAGENSGGGQSSDSYFLENMIGTVVGNPPSARLGSPTPILNANNVITRCDSSYDTIYPYLTSGNSKAADMFFLEGTGSRPTLNLIPIIELSTDQNQTVSIFKYLPFNNGKCVPGGSQVKFYKSLAVSSTSSSEKLSQNQLEDVSTYPNFNIAGKNSNGNRLKEVELIGYFKSLMYKQPAPANAPIWQIEDDPYPSLLQLQKL